MKFTNDKIEIELEHPNTFNIAERLGFKPVEDLISEPIEEVVEEVVEEPKQEIVEEKKLPADGFYNCKKCDFKTTNKGELLAHYRAEHPKEDK